MFHRLTLIFICLSLISPVPALPQERMILSLEQCVNIALDKNPEFQIVQKELTKSKIGIWEAVADLMPMIDASASLSHAWDIQTSKIPNFLKPMLAPLAPSIPELAEMPDFVQLAFGLENTVTYGVTLSQPIFLGGAGIAGVQMAYASRRSTRNLLESTRQNIIFQTVDAFYACLLARELVSVQEEALDEALANLDLVQKKYDAGSASGFDKMRAEVEVANLKPEVIGARNNHQVAMTGLRMILGLSTEDQFDVEGHLEYAPDTFEGITLDELETQAFEKRPDLLDFTAQKDIARMGIALARSEFMPKLYFSTDYSFLAMKNDLKLTQDDFSKGFTSAISLTVPLFRSLKNYKGVQKARLDYKIIIDSEKQVEDGIRAEVEIAYNLFQEAKEKYKSAKESIDLAEEALRLANLMYEEGASTQLDVLSSQLAMTQSRLNYATALYEYQMSRYELRRVSGTLVGILD